MANTVVVFTADLLSPDELRSTDVSLEERGAAFLASLVGFFRPRHALTLPPRKKNSLFGTGRRQDLEAGEAMITGSIAFRFDDVLEERALRDLLDEYSDPEWPHCTWRIVDPAAYRPPPAAPSPERGPSRPAEGAAQDPAQRDPLGGEEPETPRLPTGYPFVFAGAGHAAGAAPRVLLGELADGSFLEVDLDKTPDVRLVGGSRRDALASWMCDQLGAAGWGVAVVGAHRGALAEQRGEPYVRAWLETTAETGPWIRERRGPLCVFCNLDGADGGNSAALDEIRRAAGPGFAVVSIEREAGRGGHATRATTTVFVGVPALSDILAAIDDPEGQDALIEATPSGPLADRALDVVRYEHASRTAAAGRAWAGVATGESLALLPAAQALAAEGFRAERRAKIAAAGRISSHAAI